MSRKKPIDISENSNQALPQKVEDASLGARRLTDQEKLELRRDMLESSAWAKAELTRRRKNNEEGS
jgi:hypothetical protein